MAQIITRLYDSAEASRKMERAFLNKRYPRRDVRVFEAGDADTQKAMTEKMTAERIADSAAKTYAKKLADNGGAVVMVRASYKPLQAKTIAREMFAASDAVDMGKMEQENFVKDPVVETSSILPDHPRFLTPAPNPDKRPSLMSQKLGVALLSKRKPMKSSVISGGRRMSGAFWPQPLLRKGLFTKSHLSEQGPISNRFSWAPLLTKSKREPSVIKGGKLIFADNLGIPSVIRR